MPNWCSTRIIIKCNDEEKMKNFEEKLRELISHNYMENGFGLTWLGNLVGNSGIGTVDENKETDLRCRGSITYMEKFGEELFIDTETAWAPMLKVFVKLLEKYLPEAELIYEAEEPGCGVYYTNDPDLVGKYSLGAYGCDDVNSAIDYNEEEVVNELKKIVKTESDNLDEVLKALWKSEFATDVWFYQWEYLPAEEWD